MNLFGKKIIGREELEQNIEIFKKSFDRFLNYDYSVFEPEGKKTLWTKIISVFLIGNALGGISHYIANTSGSEIMGDNVTIGIITFIIGLYFNLFSTLYSIEHPLREKDSPKILEWLKPDNWNLSS